MSTTAATSLIQTLRAKAASTKSASAKPPATPVADPADKGVIKVPAHPDGDNPGKLGLPAGQGTNKDEGVPFIPSAGSAGEGAPSVKKTEKLASLSARVRAVASADHKSAAVIPVAAPGAAAAAKPVAAPAVAAADAKPVVADKKAGAGEQFELTDEVRTKLAFADAILSTESGKRLAEEELIRQRGRESSVELLKRASELRSEAELQAADQEAYASYIEKLSYIDADLRMTLDGAGTALQKSASWTDSAFALHTKTAHSLSQDDPIKDILIKAAYVQGVKLAAAMVPPDVAQEELAAPVPGAEGTEIPPEELIAMVEAMLASGEIDEATAAQLISELEAELAAAGGEGGAPAAGMPAEMPAEKIAASVLNKFVPGKRAGAAANA